MKPELRWTDWTTPFDGIEWLNGDSEWRDEPPSRLARVLLTYPGRAAASLATLLDRPDEVLRRWDALTRRRRIVAIAGSDAHARLGLRRSGDVYENTASLPLPAYEQVFRAFSLALPQLRLTGKATADAAALIEEIRAGHVYSSVDSFAAPAQLAFTAVAGTSRANAGDLLQPTGPVTLRVDTNAPADAEIRLLKDGEPIASARGRRLERIVPPDPAVYRVEVELATPSGQAAMPWILSNPIYLRAPGPEPVAPGRAPARSFVVQYEDGRPRDWVVENSPRSSGAIDVALAVPGTQLLMRYAVGGSVAESPFVAFAMPAGDAIATADRLMFTAHADRPMRLSVQLRIPSGVAGERWQRSIYLDQMPRDVTVFFDDMIPRGPTTARRPTLADVRSVLFVVDSVNSKPGTSGQFWIDDVRYGK
jgi:hypothetical protein